MSRLVAPHRFHRTLRPWGGVLAWLCATLPAWAQADGACQRESRADPPALALVMAAVALREHTLMGGALIDVGGGLIRQGYAEAEQDRAPESDRPTWQRVWGYWRATPGARPAGSAAATPSAQQRATLVDQPWSAAFIGHVMRQAGLGPQQFRYSASHHDYVRAALASTDAEARGGATHYAYRACDLAVTAPRRGDLLCFARDGDGAVDRFDTLRQALATRPLRMHCDLVVRRDSAGLDAVGGNVVQSVTLRRLALEADGSGRLWTAYFDAAHRSRLQAPRAPAPAEGVAEALLPDTHLNRKPWSVLLQLRGGGAPPPPLRQAQAAGD